VNDTLQNAISLFVGALTTVLLMAGNYYFGGRRRDRSESKDSQEHTHERLEDQSNELH
jgi:hypothetical protein